MENNLTLAEQRALRSQSLLKLSLTPSYQNKAADKLIQSLQIKLGQAESYIQELEEKIQSQEREYTALQTRLKTFLDKYSADMKSLYQEPVIAKLKEENLELSKEVTKLKDVRDKLINQLNNERLVKSDKQESREEFI